MPLDGTTEPSGSGSRDPEASSHSSAEPEEQEPEAGREELELPGNLETGGTADSAETGPGTAVPPADIARVGPELEDETSVPVQVEQEGESVQLGLAASPAKTSASVALEPSLLRLADRRWLG